MPAGSGISSGSSSSRISAQMRTRSRFAASVLRWQKASCRPSGARVADGDAAARRVQPDQVAHAGVGAEGAAVRGGRAVGALGGVGQADQRLADLRQRVARLAPGQAQVGEQAVERAFAVERGDDVVLEPVTVRSRPTGWQPCVTRETRPVPAAKATPDRPPCSTVSAMCSVRLRAEARPPNR